MYEEFYDDLPGSRGHSLSFENSICVFPVRTQLELRSIIGILLKKKKNKTFSKEHLNC